MSNFIIQGKVVSIADAQPVQGASVEVYSVNLPGWTTALAATAWTDAVGHFSAHFAHGTAPRPNIILKVSQTVGGITSYIYSENPAIDTRTAIADVVNITIKASGRSV